MNHKILAASLTLLASCEKEATHRVDNASLSDLRVPSRPIPTLHETPLEPRESLRTFIRIRPRAKPDHLYAGVPLAPRKLTVLNNIGYDCGYDESTRTPAWVAYKLTKHGPPGTNLQAPNLERFSFSTDQRTASLITAKLFSRSGFDRGHMAPNDAIGVEYGEEAQRETFKMSNIAAQRPSFNRGIWKQFETAESNYWANSREELWVIVGAVVSDPHHRIRSSGNSVAVPSEFYRIYIDEEAGELKTMAMTIPAEAHAGRPTLRSIREIEALSQLDFNPEMPTPAQDHLEHQKATRFWPTKEPSPR
jgi:endonuclease G